MERERDFDLAEDLCRVYREIERRKAVHMDLCDHILRSPSEHQRHREWMPASEWTRNMKGDS